MIKKIVIKNHECCTFAHVGNSTYNQMKQDIHFENIDVQHKIDKHFNNLQVIIDDEIFFDWVNRSNNAAFKYPAELVASIKEKYSLKRRTKK